MKKLNNYKVPSDSETIKTEVVCPNDTNPMGILQSGHLVEWMDIAAECIGRKKIFNQRSIFYFRGP